MGHSKYVYGTLREYIRMRSSKLKIPHRDLGACIPLVLKYVNFIAFKSELIRSVVAVLYAYNVSGESSPG